jgi:hypothetical protein
MSVRAGLSVCAGAIFCALAGVCYAQPLTSTELIEGAKAYDGRVVSYAGEVIGDVMVRRDHAWVNLNDGANAVGVWIEKKFARDIIYTGSYRSQGDWIEVTGIFNRACRQHGGDLDIHAQAVRIVTPGRLIQEHLNQSKLYFFFILAGILCLILVLMRLRLR